MPTTGLHPLGWLRSLWRRLDANRSLGLGAEMAFWLFLSLLPLAGGGGLVTARVASESGSVMAPMLESLPRATRELVGRELDRVAAWKGGQVGLWAGLTFVWLASSGIHSIFDGIEIESEALPRPWWQKRVLAVGTCGALSLGVALLTLLGTGLGRLWQLVGRASALRALELESSSLGQVVRLVTGLGVAFGLVSGLYWIALPPPTRRTMPIAPGASLAIALQVVLGFGYAFYLKKAGDGGAYEVGLAAIGVTLTALYLFCVVLLVGVAVNSMLGEQPRSLVTARPRPHHTRPGSPRSAGGAVARSARTTRARSDQSGRAR